MAIGQLPADVSQWVKDLAGSLHQRVEARLLPMLLGCLFARGRRTVASWLRGADVGADFRAHYYFLGSLGRLVRWVALRLFRIVLQVVSPGERLLFALDDTPTKRYGPCVEGAGIHHNPTPDPPTNNFPFAPVWVPLAWFPPIPPAAATGFPQPSALHAPT